VDSAKGRTDRLYHGGPVEPAGIMALLRSRTKPEDAKAVVEDVLLFPAKGARENGRSGAVASTFRIYLGYAGWGAGQLAWELKMTRGTCCRQIRDCIRCASRNAVAASGEEQTCDWRRAVFGAAFGLPRDDGARPSRPGFL